jgi:hypothetical protein
MLPCLRREYNALQCIFCFSFSSPFYGVSFEIIGNTQVKKGVERGGEKRGRGRAIQTDTGSCHATRHDSGEMMPLDGFFSFKTIVFPRNLIQLRYSTFIMNKKTVLTARLPEDCSYLYRYVYFFLREQSGLNRI